jgi:hypothetical protein
VRALPAAIVIAFAAACGGSADSAPPVATPSVTAARTEVAVGSPVEMSYRFAVAPDAPAFREDYWVFVHFLNGDGELMWTDDHQPPTPTRAWKPGAAIEYSRTMFVPGVPYAGPAIVELGLFSPETGERLPLNADTSGQRSYAVSSLNLVTADETRTVAFRDGWHPAEMADDEAGTEWQWSMRQATLAFRNPRRDITFYLQLDQPVNVLPAPQEIEIRTGGEVVDRLTVAPGRAVVHRFPLTAEQLGDAETVELSLTVDRTFVPARVPELKSADPRELGVRVFRGYFEPR